jgi:hypothetical protein
MRVTRVVGMVVFACLGLFLLTPTQPAPSDPSYSSGDIRHDDTDDWKSGLRLALERHWHVEIKGRLRWLALL